MTGQQDEVRLTQTIESTYDGTKEKGMARQEEEQKREKGCWFDRHRHYQLSASLVRTGQFRAWAEVGNKKRSAVGLAHIRITTGCFLIEGPLE